ncbi:MAG TPA: FG-GAP-like repeat-containing protein [Pyrinomonadaceae bacterium]|jgi:hypothetical protein
MQLVPRQKTARQLSLTLLVVLVLSLSAVSVSAQSPTFIRTDYSGLGNNQVVGDFNNDGKLDLAGQGAMSAAVMLSNGDGTFGVRVEYPVASWNQDLAAGDFNGDGKLDLVVTINEPHTSLSLLTGNGDGTFGAPVNFPNTSGFDSPTIVATDLNNDGKLDLVIGHQVACYTAPCTVARTITVMLGLGDGTFQPAKEIDIGTETAKIAVGDFNRDGFKDLGIASSRARVCLLLGVGDGTFNQQPTLTLITENNLGMDATDIDVADFNGDTLEDLVVAVALNGSKTAILTGNGDGTFRQPPLLLTEPGINVPQYQAVADYNGDGFQDLALALANGNSGLMEILNGNGDGTFQPPVYYLKPPDRSSLGGIAIITADFNKDSKPDIALGIGGASHSMAVLRNTTGSASVPLAYGSITVTPSSVTGGTSATVSVNLATGAVAPAGGLQFAVSSSNTAAVTVPSTILMPAGSSSVKFNASTRSVTSTQTASIRVSHNQLGSRSVSLTVTPTPSSTITVSALTLTPSSVTGGNTVQGKVTLSATAPAATTVSLASNSARATVPVSVTVPVGATSATFNINTTTVTSTTSATISASLNGVTRNATLTINPASSTTDTVTITRAEYETDKRTLRVEATSTRSTATLQVFITASGQLIGTLMNNGGGKYSREFSVSTNPQSITVRSSLGGSATKAVVAR